MLSPSLSYLCCDHVVSPNPPLSYEQWKKKYRIDDAESDGEGGGEQRPAAGEGST